ncbi:hypothetical protein BC827DRAFT_1197781 [Russula dissimulans]|nr:hypothetical protein BC827DRAFT_1197781 [Russula dissimulans]
MGGLYIWEFFTHLDYEWSVIRGHRPYRWTIWLYSTTRFTTLMAGITDLVIIDMVTPINCKIWTVFEAVFAHTTFSISSLLILLRVIAIWNKNKFIVAFSATVWVANTALLIRGIVRTHSQWEPIQNSCKSPDIESNRLTFIAVLVSDVTLLVTMFIGLLRLRQRGGGRFGLGRLLWKQGIIYLFVATTAEVVPVVFLCLNLNDAFDLMFIAPSVTTMSIAATRMYRSLADFVLYPDNGKGPDNSQRNFHSVSIGKWATTMPNPRNRIEVEVHGLYEHPQPSTSQTDADENVTFMATDGQLGDKPHGLTSRELSS